MNDTDGILQAVMRHKGLVITCGVLLGAAGFGVSEITPPVYEATARLEIRRPPERTAWSEQALGPSSAQVENLNLFTCAEMVKRRTLLVQLAQELEQRGTWIATARLGDRGRTFPWTGVSVAQASPMGLLSAAPASMIDACVLELGAMIAVHPVRDTRLLDVVVDAGAPEVARSIANRLATLYVDDERRRSCSADTAGIATLEQELTEARDRLRAHGQESPPAGDDERLRSRRERLTQAMAQLDGDRQRALEARRDAEQRLVRLDRYASAPDTGLWEPSGNEALDAIHHDLVSCSRHLAAARAIYRPLHPKLAAIDSEYAQLRALERRTLPAVSRELRGLANFEAAHAARLQAAMADSEQALASVQAREASLGGVAARAQADRELEGRLVDRIRDRLLEAPLDPAPVNLVDAATVDPEPVRPRRALNVLAGTLAGLLLGMGMGLMRRPKMRALERPDEIEDQLELPVVAVLPERVGGSRS